MFLYTRRCQWEFRIHTDEASYQWYYIRLLPLEDTSSRRDEKRMSLLGYIGRHYSFLQPQTLRAQWALINDEFNVPRQNLALFLPSLAWKYWLLITIGHYAALGRRDRSYSSPDGDDICEHFGTHSLMDNWIPLNISRWYVDSMRHMMLRH